MDDFQPDDFAADGDDFQADDFQPDTSPVTREYGAKDYIGDIARPLLEGGGAAVGGILGFGAGAPTGVGAPFTTTAGSIGGYAIGKSAADLLDRQLGRKAPISGFPEAIRETGENLYEGAKVEATGKVLSAAVPPILKGLGNVGGKLGEWATAIPEKDFGTVAKHPTSIFPGTLAKAGEQFDDAMRGAGISKELTPEVVDRMRNPGQYAFDTFNKLKTSGSITPQEALHGRQSLDAIYPVPNKKNGSYIRMLDQIRDSFQDVISGASPALQKASKNYAIAKSGEKFQSLFPRTNSGKPAYFRSGAILAGLMAGRPEAMFGIPAVAGVTAATVGGTGSVASSIFKNPATRRLLSSPINKATNNLFPDRGVINPSNNVDQNPNAENNATPQNQVVDGGMKQKSPPKYLDEKTAREYLKRAGGDKKKARELAIKDGWEIPS